MTAAKALPIRHLPIFTRCRRNRMIGSPTIDNTHAIKTYATIVLNRYISPTTITNVIIPNMI